MIKQTVFVSTARSLSLRDGQLVIAWKDTTEGVVTRPIEDIACVVLEHQQISITLPLLNALVSNNVAVVLCDAKAMPAALLQPLEANTTQAEVLRTQIEAKEPMKKQLWKQLVEAKIRNQAATLATFGKDGTALLQLSREVKSGDTDNREGAAARLYWSALFGDSFRRERYGDPPNGLLNYGYAILRAATARALVGSGLLPALGLFHRNKYNAFPLADDVMESYRPYVDEAVVKLVEQGVSEVNNKAKGVLFSILDHDVIINNVRRPLQSALTTTTASLVKNLAGETRQLLLPHFE